MQQTKLFYAKPFLRYFKNKGKKNTIIFIECSIIIKSTCYFNININICVYNYQYHECPISACFNDVFIAVI